MRISVGKNQRVLKKITNGKSSPAPSVTPPSARKPAKEVNAHKSTPSHAGKKSAAETPVTSAKSVKVIPVKTKQKAKLPNKVRISPLKSKAKPLLKKVVSLMTKQDAGRKVAIATHVTKGDKSRNDIVNGSQGDKVDSKNIKKFKSGANELSIAKVVDKDSPKSKVVSKRVDDSVDKEKVTSVVGEKMNKRVKPPTGNKVKGKTMLVAGDKGRGDGKGRPQEAPSMKMKPSKNPDVKASGALLKADHSEGNNTFTDSQPTPAPKSTPGKKRGPKPKKPRVEEKEQKLANKNKRQGREVEMSDAVLPKKRRVTCASGHVVSGTCVFVDGQCNRALNTGSPFTSSSQNSDKTRLERIASVSSLPAGMVRQPPKPVAPKLPAKGRKVDSVTPIPQIDPLVEVKVPAKRGRKKKIVPTPDVNDALEEVRPAPVDKDKKPAKKGASVSPSVEDPKVCKWDSETKINNKIAEIVKASAGKTKVATKADKQPPIKDAKKKVGSESAENKPRSVQTVKEAPKKAVVVKDSKDKRKSVTTVKTTNQHKSVSSSESKTQSKQDNAKKKPGPSRGRPGRPPRDDEALERKIRELDCLLNRTMTDEQAIPSKPVPKVPKSKLKPTRAKKTVLRQVKNLGNCLIPRKHRMAGLTALAKVRCLYENENLPKGIDPSRKSEPAKKEVKTNECLALVPKPKHKVVPVKTIVRRDKRIASLNAKAIMAASVSMNAPRKRAKSHTIDSVIESVVRESVLSTSITEISHEAKCDTTLVHESDKILFVKRTGKRTISTDVKTKKAKRKKGNFSEEKNDAVEIVQTRQAICVRNDGSDLESVSKEDVTMLYTSSTTTYSRARITAHSQSQCQTVLRETSHTVSSKIKQVGCDKALKDTEGSETLERSEPYSPLCALATMQPPPGSHNFALPTPVPHVKPTGAVLSPIPPPPHPSYPTPNLNPAQYQHGFYQPAGPLIHSTPMNETGLVHKPVPQHAQSQPRALNYKAAQLALPAQPNGNHPMWHPTNPQYSPYYHTHHQVQQSSVSSYNYPTPPPSQYTYPYSPNAPSYSYYAQAPYPPNYPSDRIGRFLPPSHYPPSFTSPHQNSHLPPGNPDPYAYPNYYPTPPPQQYSTYDPNSGTECPFQTYQKNVHVGPLIGSLAGKGPGSQDELKAGETSQSSGQSLGAIRIPRNFSVSSIVRTPPRPAAGDMPPSVSSLSIVPLSPNCTLSIVPATSKTHALPLSGSPSVNPPEEVTLKSPLSNSQVTITKVSNQAKVQFSPAASSVPPRTKDSPQKKFPVVPPNGVSNTVLVSCPKSVSAENSVKVNVKVSKCASRTRESVVRCPRNEASVDDAGVLKKLIKARYNGLSVLMRSANCKTKRARRSENGFSTVDVASESVTILTYRRPKLLDQERLEKLDSGEYEGTSNKVCKVVANPFKNRKVNLRKKQLTLVKKVGLPVAIPLPHHDLAPKWSNGWRWEGEPKPSFVYIRNDDPPISRVCYAAMRHKEGDKICPGDCILLKSGAKNTDLPFVARVAALWENPDDGEMMVSVLWYYRPEHTDLGRDCSPWEDEIFASRHRDVNSVACIEDKCFVLTFNEYCRYRKRMKMLEEGGINHISIVPELQDAYPRDRQIPQHRVALDRLFFCHRVYDFRQKRILKNPM